MKSGVTSGVRIQLFGRFVVTTGTAELRAASWTRRRPADLLKLIALSPSRSLHREEVMDRLWPDKDLERAANNLHRALHDLRQAVGAEVVSLDKGVLRLADDAWVDVEEFERLAASKDRAGRERALALYEGDLSPDDRYDDAISLRREALRQRFLQCALGLGAEAIADGRLDAAETIARRVLEVDPASERGHRLMMLALARSGRRHEALRQFAACGRALEDHLDASPAPETVALNQAIAEGREGPPAPASPREGLERVSLRLLGTRSPPPMHGRADSLEAVRPLLERGEGVLLILGEAGVGKTRFALGCAAASAREGRRLLAGAWSESGATPYAAFAEAFAGEAGDPFRAFAPSRDPAADKARLFAQVEAAVRSAASGGGLVLIADDLQFADESGLQLFHHLARCTRRERLLLIATCQGEEVRAGRPIHALLSNLHRERLAERVALDRLDPAASDALVADLLRGRAPGGLGADVYRVAEGNPFYTEELVRSGVGLGIPRDLQELIRVRVSRAGAAAENLLVAASIVGPRFGFEVARAVAGQEHAEALDALDAALAARIVEEDDRGYRFHHGLIREALYAGLARARRRHLHLAVAAALEDAGDAEPEVLAHHWIEGGRPDAAVPPLLEAAQRSMAKAGLLEAARHLDRAREVLQAMEAPGPQLYGVLVQLGMAQLALSELGPAVRHFDAAAALGPPPPSPAQRAEALRWAAFALVTNGDLPGAQARLDAACAALADAPDDPQWSNVLYQMALQRWHEGRHREAFEAAQRSLAIAEKHGAPGPIAQAYEMLALACHSLGDWQLGLSFEEQRRSLVGGAFDVEATFDAHL